MLQNGNSGSPVYNTDIGYYTYGIFTAEDTRFKKNFVCRIQLKKKYSNK